MAGSRRDEQADEPADGALEALREGEHDEDEDQAVGGDGDVRADRGGQPVARRQVGDVGLHQDDHQGAPDGAGQRAQAADDRRGQQRDGQRDRVRAGRHQRGRDGEQGAGQAGARRADHEREHPRGGHIDPGQRGGDLVVTHRPPVTADPATAEVGQQRQRHQGGGRRDPGLPPGQREAGAEESGRGEDDVQPLVAAQGALVGVRDGRQRDAEHERRAGQVRPAQPGRRDTHDRAGGRGEQAGDQQDDDERPAQVHQEQRGGVRADGHERAVAQRDLAAQPGEHGEPGDSGRIRGDLGDLEVAERVQLDGQERHDDGGDQDAGQRPQQRVLFHT
jgi:hypothetical protein